MRTIGFTGTRLGMSIAQREKVEEYMTHWAEVIDDLIIARQGCCVGSDEDFTRICNKIGYPPIALVAHPPVKTEYLSIRAQTLSHYVKRARGYLSRDRDIVDASDLLIATPAEHEDTVGPNRRRTSGTWYTITYAQSHVTPVYIVYPDGSVKEPA